METETAILKRSSLLKCCCRFRVWNLGLFWKREKSYQTKTSSPINVKSLGLLHYFVGKVYYFMNECEREKERTIQASKYFVHNTGQTRMKLKTW